ncbi:Adaptor protein complex beta subunit [Lactarius indigo]|nr:Adaptor protein complex beta subunit [Lactarius indigo]
MNVFSRAAPKKEFELRADLNSEYRDKRKDAIKKVIANMTVGKDVSGLFPDVLKNMQTEDIEQKKLVYLYLINYAKTQPSSHPCREHIRQRLGPNPLIRALAIIIDYIAGPLQKSLHDENPYVRKTAALCVAKLYDLKPELVLENGFLEQLHEMISDSNPMVVANTITALADIHTSATSQPSTSSSDPAVFTVTPTILKLLIALNECSEWGRVAISQDEKESEHICERVVPQFQHVNGSVVLGAVRREDFNKQLIRKMAPPLSPCCLLHRKCTISCPTRCVYFPASYNDPLYVKVEKLDIMVRLANENNVDALLSELKEYVGPLLRGDVDFVRRSIKAIGQAAVKIEAGAERCVNVLLDLIATRVSYVVQEAVVVMKVLPSINISGKSLILDRVIPTLCANLEELDEPEAKASLIWIIGEYANKIDNADELLNIFVETFTEESYSVQLQTLTAVVKLFLFKPDTSQGLVQRILNTATKDCDSPDVRDRAYIYWRLLSTDPGAAKSVVLAHRPPISLPRTTVAPALLNELIGEVSSLASVYQKPAATFIGQGRVGAEAMQRRGADLADSAKAALQTVAAGQVSEKSTRLRRRARAEQPTGLAATQVLQQPAAKNIMSGTSTNPLDDLVSIFGSSSLSSSGGAPALDPFLGFGEVVSPIAPAAATQPTTASNQQEDLLGLF